MSKPTKKIRVKKSDIGRWVTVQFTDVGRRDGVLAHLSEDRRTGEILETIDGITFIETKYIVDIRDFLIPA